MWGGASLDPEAFDPSEFEDNMRTLQATTFDDERRASELSGRGGT